MRDLRGLLVDGPSYAERLALQCALAHPCCWPHEPALRERALVLGFTEPAQPHPGEVWLISVAQPLGSRTSLWKLHRAALAGGRGGVVPVVGLAAESLNLAERIPSRMLPIFSSLDPLQRRGRWVASFVAQAGSDLDEVLDGRSFGLSMALAVVSLLIGRAVPGDLLASATLEPDGRVGPVDGLREKVLGVKALALGIQRLLETSSGLEKLNLDLYG